MLQEILVDYLAIFPDERAKLTHLQEQLEAGETMNDRKNFHGHITAGALVLSPKRDKILIIHHKLFDKWLQPGGHWDPDESDPWSAARREAEEETSVRIAQQLSPFEDMKIPLDISSHKIMARSERNEPAHHHHDFRYVFLAASEQLRHLEKEVHAAAWMQFDDPRTKYIRPLIDKLRYFALIV